MTKYSKRDSRTIEAARERKELMEREIVKLHKQLEREGKELDAIRQEYANHQTRQLELAVMRADTRYEKTLATIKYKRRLTDILAYKIRKITY